MAGRNDMPDQYVPKEFVQHLLTIRESAVSFSYAVLHDFHAAEDAYQEAVAVVVQKADTFQGTGFKTWFWTILRNVVGTRIRAIRRNTLLVDSSILEHISGYFADDDARSDDMEHLLECLKRLSGTARRVMEWRFMESLSCAEIAKKVNRTVQATYALLKRAKEIVRDCVRERREDDSAGEETT